MYISGSIEFLASKGSERRLITLRTESGEEQDYMVYNTVIPKELKLSIDVFYFIYLNI